MPTKALLPIPSDLAPSSSKCVRFQVPDDPEWLGLFWGALYQLGVWSSYDRDDDHSARGVAVIWQNIIETARDADCSGAQFGCDFPFETDPFTWVILDPYGAYAGGTGFYSTTVSDPPDAGYALFVYDEFGVTAFVTHIRVTISVTCSGNDVVAIYRLDGSTPVLISSIQAVACGPQIIDIPINQSLLNIAVNMSGNHGGFAYLHDVTVYTNDVSICG